MIFGLSPKRFWIAGRKTKKSMVAQDLRKVENGMRNEFLDGITFEEDPFEGETPESVRTFDLEGNEVN